MSVKGVASHEIGHALGLAHPHDGHDPVGDGDSPYSDDLVKSYDSVMSYESEGFYLTDTPMMFDYHIMKGLYGGNQTLTGDDSYVYNVDEFHLKLDSGNSRAGFNVREMLHDPDGNDSVKLVSQWKTPGADGVYFNLNMGSSSNFEDVTPITDDSSKLKCKSYLSDYTQIENLMTTAGNDVVDATVTWAVSVDLADGDDEVSTNGHGGSFEVEPISLLFIQPTFHNFMWRRRVPLRVLCEIWTALFTVRLLILSLFIWSREWQVLRSSRHGRLLPS